MNFRKMKRIREGKPKFEETLLETYPNTEIDLTDDKKTPPKASIRKQSVLEQKSYQISKGTVKSNEKCIGKTNGAERIIRQQREVESIMKLRKQVSIKEKNDVSQFLKKFPQLCGTQNKENTNVTENGLRDSPEYDINVEECKVNDSSKKQRKVVVANKLNKVNTDITGAGAAAAPEEVVRKLIQSERTVTIGTFRLCINDLQTLEENNWINDQIINAYMFLIEQRSKEQSCLPKIFALDTLIYQQLDYDEFRDALKWTRNVNIYDYEMIMFPICIGRAHWCLIVIDLKYCVIKYYDSLKFDAERVFKIIRKYLHKLQRQSGRCIKNFKTVVPYVPKQNNSDDCGVFTCMFAEQVSKRGPIRYSQKDMSEYRYKILKSLLAKKLIDDEELVEATSEQD